MYRICENVNFILLSKTNLRFLKRDATLGTHPLTLLFIVVFFYIGVTTSTVAISSALLCVRTTDTFFTALLSTNDIEYRCANNKHDGGKRNIINDIHNYALRAYSALSCLFFLIIMKVKIAAIASVITQPTMGIQAAPKLPPVKSVPKKNTRNPITYPTAN